MFTRESHSARALFVISKYLFKNEGLLKVTASHVHRICGNISKTVPVTVGVTINHE